MSFHEYYSTRVLILRPISGSDNCPYDYIKIYDGKDESAAVIGTFCGMGKFPYSIIGTSQDLFVEFVSSPAGKLLRTVFIIFTILAEICLQLNVALPQSSPCN